VLTIDTIRGHWNNKYIIMQSNNANFKTGVTDISVICLIKSMWDHDMEKK